MQARRGGRGGGEGGVGISIGSDVVSSKGIDALLRHACASGILRMSNRNLTCMPPEVFALQGLDYSDKQWWAETPLTVLDFSHNEIKQVAPPAATAGARPQPAPASGNAMPAPPPVFTMDNFAAMFHALRLLVGSYNRLDACPTPLLLVCAAGITKIDFGHNALKSFDVFLTPAAAAPTTCGPGSAAPLNFAGFGAGMGVRTGGGGSGPMTAPAFNAKTPMSNNNPQGGSIKSPNATFPCLVELDLSHNQLTSIHGIALACPQLEKLDLAHNQLTGFEALPAVAAPFQVLRHLSIHHNQLEWLGVGVSGGDGAGGVSRVPPSPPSFHLPQLELLLPQVVHLDASYNQLTVTSILPSVGGLCLPPSLVTLNLQVNRIAALAVEDPSSLSVAAGGGGGGGGGRGGGGVVPPAVGNGGGGLQLVLPHCPTLKELYLGFNKMATPPGGALSRCPALQMLDASNNNWSDVQCVLSCPDLARLDIQNNTLSTLPPQLGYFKRLTAIVLDGNPMRAIRRDVVAKGTVELMAYLRSRDSAGGGDAPPPPMPGRAGGGGAARSAGGGGAAVAYLAPETLLLVAGGNGGGGNAVPGNYSAGTTNPHANFTSRPEQQQQQPRRKVDDRPFATELNQRVVSDEAKARDGQCLRTGTHTGNLWDLSAGKQQPPQQQMPMGYGAGGGGGGRAGGGGMRGPPPAAVDLPPLVTFQLGIAELHSSSEEDFRGSVHVVKIARQPRMERFDLSFLWPFHNIRELDLSECSNLAVVSIPTSGFYPPVPLAPPAVLPSLQILNLSKCGVVVLPPAGAAAGIPPSRRPPPPSPLGEVFASPFLVRLTRLDLSYNRQLAAVPAELAALAPSLRSLNLNGCISLQHFPMALGYLHELNELSLNSCGLSDFPSDEEVAPIVGPVGFAEASWPKLQLLDLGNNNLTTIPFSIGRMQPHLRNLVLDGNAIKWLRPMTIAKGPAHVLQFLLDKIPTG